MKNNNTSSSKSQREMRLEKMSKLKKLGINPFAVKSEKSFDSDFLDFWFDFAMKFDFKKFLEEYGDYSELEYFLQEVLNPPTLLEIAENRLFSRKMKKGLSIDIEEIDVEIKGFDQDGFENSEDIVDFDKDYVVETRKLFGNINQKNEEERYFLRNKFLDTQKDDENQIILRKDMTISLCGKIKSKRNSGKISFVTLQDESFEKGFQIIVKKDVVDSVLESDKSLDTTNIQDLINCFDVENLKNFV